MTAIHSSLTLEMGDGESPMSLCSRTARFFNRTAREFCLDMNLSFQGIVDGDPDALKALAHRCRVDHDRLMQSSFIKIAERRYRLRTQDFVRDAMSRAALRVCPHCLLEDIEMRAGPKPIRPYGRTVWLLSSIRTCQRHQTALIEVARAPYMHRLHDFARLIEPFLVETSRFIQQSRERRFSRLETYLVDRLNNVADGASWLQKLPFYAAARTCEVLGAIATRGFHFKAKGFTEEDWHDSGAVGFDIANAGERGIRSLLSQLETDFKKTDGEWGPQRVLGRLYTWLAHDSKDSAFDPLREVVREYLIETMPVGPGDAIFGQNVHYRQRHSIWSAYREYRITPKRLRKLLCEGGFIGRESLAFSDDRITFDAQEAHDFLSRLSNAVSLRGVEEYINAPRQIVNLLCKAGFIGRWKSANGRLTHAFAKEDLDDFLEQLLSDATELKPSDKNLLSIQKAAKRSSCSSADIVRLLFDHKLVRVRRHPNERAFSSVLVNLDEVKCHVQGPDLKGLKLRDVEKRLRASSYAVKALVEGNYLPSGVARNPVKRCPQRYVKETDLDEFMERFASIDTIAREFRTRRKSLKPKLDALGIAPKFVLSEVDLPFYDWTTISAHFSDA